MRKALAVLLAVISWSGVPVSAATLDPEALRRDLEAAFSRGLSPMLAQPIEVQRIRTTAQGDAVRVEIQGMRVPLADLQAQLVIGDMGFTVADAGPGLTRVSEVSLPGGATLRDQEGRDVAYVNYRLDRLDGVWASALASFLDIEFEAGGIEVIVPAEGIAASLDRVAAEADWTRRPDGLFDQDSLIRAAGLRVLLPEAGHFTVAALEGEVSVRGQDMTIYEQLMVEFGALGGDGKAPTPEQLAAFLERMSRADLFPEGGREHLGLSDLLMTDTAGRELFSLGRVELEIAGNDLRGDRGSGDVGLRFQDLAVAPEPGTAAAPLRSVIPENAGFILSARRLPAQTLWRILMRGASLAATQDRARKPDPDVFGTMLGFQMLSAITQAGTTLHLERLSLDSPILDLSAQGRLEVDAASALGARGRLDAKVIGLDEVIALAQGSGAPGPDAMPDPALGVLALLKAMARREAAADGRPLDRYAVELTARGEVLVNGMPLGPGLGPGMAPGGGALQ